MEINERRFTHVERPFYVVMAKIVHYYAELWLVIPKTWTTLPRLIWFRKIAKFVKHHQPFRLCQSKGGQFSILSDAENDETGWLCQLGTPTDIRLQDGYKYLINYSRRHTRFELLQPDNNYYEFRIEDNVEVLRLIPDDEHLIALVCILLNDYIPVVDIRKIVASYI